MSPSELDASSEAKVVVSALLHLVRLLAAEMVVGEGPRREVERLIAAIDRRLNDTPLPGDTRLDTAREGIRQTRELLLPMVMQLRKQVAQAGEAKLSLDTPANQLPA
jgi:selenophosphate synthetase-related protein